MRSRTSITGRSRGFTLIELMITVVVLAILAGIAFPSFLGALRKSRRAEAFSAISAVQQAQERWRANHATYASDLTSAAPTGLGLAATTPSGYYTIAVSGTTATAYEVTATANTGTSQANDADCGKLGVKLDGGALQYSGAGMSGTLAYGSTHPCWSR